MFGNYCVLLKYKDDVKIYAIPKYMTKQELSLFVEDKLKKLATEDGSSYTAGCYIYTGTKDEPSLPSVNKTTVGLPANIHYYWIRQCAVTGNW